MQGSLLIWPIMVIWPLDVAVTTLRGHLWSFIVGNLMTGVSPDDAGGK